MADTGLTEVSATSQEIVAEIVQRELIAKAVIRPTVSDFTSWVKPGASVVKVPKAGSFTVQNKAENTAGTNQNLTLSTDDIALNKHKHIPALIEDIAQDQSAVNMTEFYLRRMASAMAKEFDTDIYTALKSVLAANDLFYATDDTLAKPDILSLRKALDDQEVPEDDRFLLVNPAQEAQMLAIDGFVDASKYGSAAPVQRGFLGSIYGFTVVKSTVCEANTTLAYHRSHVAFATQQEFKFERQRASLVWLADELSLSTIYGVQTMDGGKYGAMLTSNPA